MRIMDYENPFFDPELAASDSHLFLELKKCLSGQHFMDDTLITYVSSFLRKTMSERFTIVAFVKLSRVMKSALNTEGTM